MSDKKALESSGDAGVPTYDIDPILEFPVLCSQSLSIRSYVGIWPLQMFRRVYFQNDSDISPELRAHRALNPARAKKISRYILDNPDSYILSPITIAINGSGEFVPFGGQDRLGMLHIPMASNFHIIDGRQRIGGIMMALRKRRELASDTAPVTIYLDIGLEERQQMFFDLNAFSVRPG